MPRQVKKNSTEVPETIVAQATTAAVVDIKVEKTAKVVKAKKEPKVEASAVVASTAVAVEEQVASAVVASAIEDVEVAIAAKSAEFSAKLNQLSTMIASLKSEYKTMEKHWAKELKVAQKASSKKKRKTGNRAPSGFVKPTRISDELAKFLDKPSGTEMARTDVTRNINVYIRAHNLQDKDNGRKINPDSKLQSLLKLKKTDELTYFNLQRYMSPHFAKTIPAVAPVVASA
jgi:upstream activation factor subunit UAF30